MHQPGWLRSTAIAISLANTAHTASTSIVQYIIAVLYSSSMLLKVWLGAHGFMVFPACVFFEKHMLVADMLVMRVQV